MDYHAPTSTLDVESPVLEVRVAMATERLSDNIFFNLTNTWAGRLCRYSVPRRRPFSSVFHDAQPFSLAVPMSLMWSALFLVVRPDHCQSPCCTYRNRRTMSLHFSANQVNQDVSRNWFSMRMPMSFTCVPFCHPPHCTTHDKSLLLLSLPHPPPPPPPAFRPSTRLFGYGSSAREGESREPSVARPKKCGSSPFIFFEICISFGGSWMVARLLECGGFYFYF